MLSCILNLFKRLKFILSLTKFYKNFERVSINYLFEKKKEQEKEEIRFKD